MRMSSLNESNEQTSLAAGSAPPPLLLPLWDVIPPDDEDDDVERAVTVANSHFSNTSASSGNSGCLQWVIYTQVCSASCVCVCEALFYRWNGSTLRMREYAKRGEFDYKELYWFWFGSREYSKINRNLWTDDETLWWMIITCDKTWRLACNVDMCTVTDLRLSACGRACV